MKSNKTTTCFLAMSITICLVCTPTLFADELFSYQKELIEEHLDAPSPEKRQHSEETQETEQAITPVSGNLKAITENGNQVLLKEDGTWEYLLENETGSRQFRRSNWGMTQEEVKKREQATPLEASATSLAYTGKLGNLPVTITYIFANNKLVRGSYLINRIHMNKNDYINDYSNLKALLQKKYGKSKKDIKNWHNNIYKETKEYWGMAVSMGDLSYSINWKTDKTDITMSLAGKNFKVIHQISYVSEEHKGMEEEIQHQDTLDDI